MSDTIREKWLLGRVSGRLVSPSRLNRKLWHVALKLNYAVSSLIQIDG